MSTPGVVAPPERLHAAWSHSISGRLNGRAWRRGQRPAELRFPRYTWLIGRRAPPPGAIDGNRMEVGGSARESALLGGKTNSPQGLNPD
jgi:hypothetical protein